MTLEELELAHAHSIEVREYHDTTPRPQRPRLTGLRPGQTPTFDTSHHEPSADRL
jgi:hypothetical protein